MDRSRLVLRLNGLAEGSRFVASRQQDSLASALQPELGHARTVGKLWSARMHLAAVDGDMGGFERSLRHLIAVSRAVQGRGTNMSALVAYAILSSAESRVRREILEGRLSADARSNVAAALAGCAFPDPGVVVGGERFFALDTIESFFASGEEQPGPEAQKATDRGAAAVAPREEQLALANRVHDGWVAAMSDDPNERARWDAEINAAAAIMATNSSKVYMPLRIVLPSFAGLRASDRTARTFHDGTLVMLALESYRARVGRYPDSLDALVPNELERVPADRFAAGGTLRYRPLDAAAKDAARGYVLYSVGHDGVDNGGKAHATANSNAANRVGDGYDLILNRWD
jgi:hypothetical protein